MDHSKLDCHGFVSALASKEPTPGGGGASALIGAVGVALGNMVGSLTLGKKKYADVQDDILELKAKADGLQHELLALIARDAEVFEPLSRAYGMPALSEEEKSKKARVMEEALLQASAVPMLIMEKCCEAIELQRDFAAKGAAIAISDVGCGVVCCKAALQAASLNVFINTKAMNDRDRAREFNERANAMLEKYTALADSIFADVAGRFKQE